MTAYQSLMCYLYMSLNKSLKTQTQSKSGSGCVLLVVQCGYLLRFFKVEMIAII